MHSAFLLKGIPAIEQLVNVESLLGEDSAVFVGFPLKVEGRPSHSSGAGPMETSRPFG